MLPPNTRCGPPQPTRKSGGASWAPPVESGAKPRRKTHFGVFWRPQNASFCTIWWNISGKGKAEVWGGKCPNAEPRLGGKKMQQCTFLNDANMFVRGLPIHKRILIIHFLYITITTEKYSLIKKHCMYRQSRYERFYVVTVTTVYTIEIIRSFVLSDWTLRSVPSQRQN